ncbi:hypothetical protein M2J84_01695 [Comamonas aquatica]|uniref:hypothetical protein n=1 Tax=Comamonas aquatica TaxID=225991 RepID=UPI0022DE8721|nr:hypothetical protein [Comamonas aquatica]WBM42414.1 hypothetical protein M2J84_01695 [Comamonas aquatica]
MFAIREAKLLCGLCGPSASRWLCRFASYKGVIGLCFFFFSLFFHHTRKITKNPIKTTTKTFKESALNRLKGFKALLYPATTQPTAIEELPPSLALPAAHLGPWFM